MGDKKPFLCLHGAYCMPTVGGRSVEITLTSFRVKKTRKHKTCCAKAESSIHEDSHLPGDTTLFLSRPRVCGSRPGAVDRLLGEFSLVILALAREVALLACLLASVLEAFKEAAAARWASCR